MVGVITGWDILAHPFVTIRCFGWQVFFKALTGGKNKTFLSLLQTEASPRVTTSNVVGILDRCIGLEFRAKRIYKVLATTFGESDLLEPFFAGLVEHEQYHADVLELCREVAMQSGWRAGTFNPWEEYLPKLEEQMSSIEASLNNVISIDDAMRVVIQVESSEINLVFYAAISATDSAFVEKLKPFQQTMELHMQYLMHRIPEISPKLMPECRELRAKFPSVRA